MRMRSLRSAATSFWTSWKLGAASERLHVSTGAREPDSEEARERRTVPQVLLPHARHPRAVVGHPLPRAHEPVEDGAAVVVDDRHAGESRLDALGADADHLAVDGCGQARRASAHARAAPQSEGTHRGTVRGCRREEGGREKRSATRATTWGEGDERDRTHSRCHAAVPPCMISSTGTRRLCAAPFLRVSAAASSARWRSLPLRLLLLARSRSGASERLLEWLRLRLWLTWAGAVAEEAGLMACGESPRRGRVSWGRDDEGSGGRGRTALSDFQLDEGATGATTFLVLAMAGEDEEAQAGDSSERVGQPEREAVLSTASRARFSHSLLVGAHFSSFDSSVRATEERRGTRQRPWLQ